MPNFTLQIIAGFLVAIVMVVWGLIALFTIEVTTWLVRKLMRKQR